MIIGLDGNEANVNSRVGSGVYAYELLKEFAKSKNHNFIVYLKEKPLNDLPKQTANFKYRVFGPKKLWTQLALPVNLLIGKKPDVFFSMGHYGPRFSKVPYTITIFDLSYLHFPELFKKSDLYQLTNWSAYSIRGAKHIFAISRSTKDDIVKNYKVDPSKVTVTYMGYDNSRFKPQAKQKIDVVKKKYKLPEEYIIFIGTIQPRKNIEFLLEAFSKLGNQKLKLVIVGRKGWLFEQIFQKVKELQLASEVIFTGYVSNADLPALLSGAKLYVSPSLWEGFGIPTIEAQACGVPTVVSSVSSLPEVVGESSILINPKSVESISQGMIKVIRDNSLETRLIQDGFQNARRFSWEKCAQQTLSVLEKL